MPTSLVSIGRFARLSRLSVKQLRRYDELGLLQPAHVDPVTGYRSYAPGQIRSAATIALLRDLDVPLTVIRELLSAGPDRTAELLRREHDRRAVELDRAVRALAAVGRLADDGVLPEVGVHLGDEPPRRLAVLSAPTDPERMAEVTAGLARELAELVADPRSPFTGLYPLDLPPVFTLELGADLPDGAETPDGTRAVRLPGGPVATATHHGPVDTLTLTWWPLLASVHERGLRPAGAVRERYLDEHTTTLTVPLATTPAA